MPVDINAGSVLGADRITDAAYQAGWRGDDLVTAVAVALAESSGNANADNSGLNRNGSTDYGLWQINSVHNPDMDRIFDPYYNAEVAYDVYGRQGWNAWVAYKKGAHKQYLDDARAAVEGYQPGTSGQSSAASAQRAAAPPVPPDREKSRRLVKGMLQSISDAVAGRNGGSMQYGLPATPAGVDDGSGLRGRMAPGQGLEGDRAVKQIDKILGGLAARSRKPTPADPVAEPDAAPALASGPADGGRGAALVEAAKKYLGKPYVWGGVSSSGMDCSGLVLLAARELGIDNLPRVSRDQARAGVAVDGMDNAQAGDLLFFDAGKERGVVNHVGIYIGDGYMIHAPKTGDVVRVVKMTRRDLIAIRRVV